MKKVKKCRECGGRCMPYVVHNFSVSMTDFFSEKAVEIQAKNICVHCAIESIKLTKYGYIEGIINKKEE